MIFEAILNTLFTFTMAAHAPALDSCSSLIGTCDYYSCVEAERISCGPHGYPLGYGVNYCEKLSALEFYPARTSLGSLTFPADGNVWRDEVRTCLQEEMDDYFSKTEDVTCEGLKAFAFHSHPKCYTQSPSFCELTVESVLKVGLTIAPADLLTSESLNQVATTAAICSEQITERLKTETSVLVRMNLMKYRLVWNSVAANPESVHEQMDALKP